MELAEPIFLTSTLLMGVLKAALAEPASNYVPMVLTFLAGSVNFCVYQGHITKKEEKAILPKLLEPDQANSCQIFLNFSS